MHGSTALLYILIGGNIIGLSECLTYYYFDNARTPDVFLKLADKCDGTCYDQCTEKQRQRLDALFEMIEDGMEQGWAMRQRDQPRTVIPSGFAPVTRILTVTAIP